MLNTKINQPLRPTQHVERFLVTSILDGTYPIGAALPNERLLSSQLGVTRPTLRETLQRLENEGWVTIQHGKATVVNDYWQKGGLSLLSTLAKYGDYLPNGFITHLLAVRVTRHSNNPIFPLILNDFGSIFRSMALRYFSQQKARKTSCKFYRHLSRVIQNGGDDVEDTVKDAMEESISIWKQTKSSRGGRSGDL